MIAATLFLAAGLSLTACGGGGGVQVDQGKVDTLVSQSPTSTQESHGTATPRSENSGTKADDTDAKRPQLRLDTSEEESNQLWNAYYACLQAHGVPMNTERAAAAGGQARPLDEGPVKPKYKSAYDACEVKMPRVPPELDADRNPHYADQFRAQVACMRKKGMKIHVTGTPDSDSFGWTYDDGSGGVSDPSGTINHTCQMEAFGGK